MALCGLTFGSQAFAQSAPPSAPVISKIVYPLESGGAAGTGAKPGEQITIQGTGLKDNAPVNPQPTVVVFPTYDPAHIFKPLPVEITVAGATATEVQVTIPNNALAGGIVVQLGSGDSANKSEAKPLNIRFNRMNSFPGNYNLVETSYQPNGHAFAPDGSAWSVVDQWVFPSCNSSLAIPLADGLTRTLPNGTRTAHIATCPHNDLTGGEYAERVRVIGGMPYWTCVLDEFSKPWPVCYGANGYWDYVLPSTQYRLDANGNVETYGQAAGDLVTFTATGERLLREPCTGNYILYKRKTNPDGTITETPVTVHSDGGTAAGRYVGDGFVNPITGPGGHIGFINPGPPVPYGSASAYIERFNPDGSWHDEIVAYGSRTAFFQLFEASAFDCQGNLYYVEDVKDPRPYHKEAIDGKLHKIAWKDGIDTVVDPDLSATLNPAPSYNLQHQYMLSGINPAGDIYFERTDTPAAPNQYPDRCSANYDLWYRHPKVRGEGCEDAKTDELIRFDFSPEAMAAFKNNHLALTAGSGECNTGPFDPIPKNISLGNLGSYGIEIKNSQGAKRPARLVYIRSSTVSGCHTDGVILRGQPRATDPFFQDQCLVIPTSRSAVNSAAHPQAPHCNGAGCRELEIPVLNECPVNFIPGDQPGNGNFQIVTVHSGTVKLYFEYDWPTSITGWETPDTQKCGAAAGFDGASQKNHCKGEMSLIVDAPTTASILGHAPDNGKNPALKVPYGGGFDGPIAYWADRIGYPAPLLKAMVRQESEYNPHKTYRYEPVSGDYGDINPGTEAVYQKDPLLPYHLNFYGDLSNNQCQAGQTPGAATLSAEDLSPRKIYKYVTIDPVLPDPYGCRKFDEHTCGVSPGQIILGSSGYTHESIAQTCSICQAQGACQVPGDCGENGGFTCSVCMDSSRPIPFCSLSNQNWLINAVKSFGCSPLRNGSDNLDCIVGKMAGKPNRDYFGHAAETVNAASYGLVQVMLPKSQGYNTIEKGNAVDWRRGQDVSLRGPAAQLKATPDGAWYQINSLEVAAMVMLNKFGNLSENQDDWKSLTQAFKAFRDSIISYNNFSHTMSNDLKLYGKCGGGSDVLYPDIIVRFAAGCYEAEKTAPLCSPLYCPK